AGNRRTFPEAGELHCRQILSPGSEAVHFDGVNVTAKPRKKSVKHEAMPVVPNSAHVPQRMIQYDQCLGVLVHSRKQCVDRVHIEECVISTKHSDSAARGSGLLTPLATRIGEIAQ